tara:strand:+ start:1269 stop:2441 length:1173 start_codon:yes stop_codon:yes gene_type:complete
MIRFKRKIILGCLILFTFVACQNKQIGPDLIGASDRFDKNIIFELLQNDSLIIDTINFDSSDQAYFSATEFTEEVTWKITISGSVSGAVKLIRGTGKKIDNSNAKWFCGRSTNEYFFQENEPVKIELSIVSLDTTYSINNLIFGKEFDWHLETFNNVKHIVVEHFNSDEDLGVDTLPSRNGLNDVSTDAKDPDVIVGLSDMRVEGVKGYSMYGTDENFNGWLMSKNHTRLLELLSAPTFEELPISETVSPDNLFFNIFIYGDLSYPATSVELKVYEVDDPAFESRDAIRVFAMSLDATTTLSSSSQAVSDGWIYDIIVNWNGWKQVSIPYSAFRAANDPLTGGGGNRIKEPGRISALAISLLSYPTTGEFVKSYVDFLTITENGYPQYKK